MGNFRSSISSRQNIVSKKMETDSHIGGRLSPQRSPPAPPSPVVSPPGTTRRATAPPPTAALPAPPRSFPPAHGAPSQPLSQPNKLPTALLPQPIPRQYADPTLARIPARASALSQAPPSVALSPVTRHAADRPSLSSATSLAMLSLRTLCGNINHSWQ